MRLKTSLKSGNLKVIQVLYIIKNYLKNLGTAAIELLNYKSSYKTILSAIMISVEADKKSIGMFHSRLIL